MHPEILTKSQQKLLLALKAFKKDFYLVGGTAIALHLGHRESIDFDMFTFGSFDNTKLKRLIKRQMRMGRIVRDEYGNLTFFSLGVQITFFDYPYPIEANLEFEDYLRLPDLITLGAMKLLALGHRAKWKDYLDLYFILEKYSLKTLLNKAKKIFGDEFNERILREQLAYFDDIDWNEEVIFKEGFDVKPEVVKKKLIEHSLS